jgi:hypothetical protein
MTAMLMVDTSDVLRLVLQGLAVHVSFTDGGETKNINALSGASHAVPC